MILEKIQTVGYRVVLRDTTTGHTRTLKLTGSGPWDLDLKAGEDDAEVAVDPGTRTSVAVPPPDEAITLRLVCTRTSTSVRANAVGSGAVAWTASKKTLLGSPWRRDDHGAPFALLEKSPTLLDDLRSALPAVAIDTAECEDVDRLYSGKPPTPDTEARRSVGRAQRRGERVRDEDLGRAQLAALADRPAVPSNTAPPEPAAPATTSTTESAAPSPEKEAAPGPQTRKSRRRKADHVEAGPGELQWTAITEDGVDGFAAPWKGGTYKLMHVSGDTYGLFFQRDAGGYEVIRCGDVAEAKTAAAAHMAGMPGTQAMRAACGPKVPACPSPRSLRIFGVPDLLARYGTTDVRTAFTAAVGEGMSLCADHAGLQDRRDLSVEDALTLLAERGEGALYALADAASLLPSNAPRSPRADASSNGAPAPPAREIAAENERPQTKPIPETKAPTSETKVTAPDDEELLKSFSAELENVLGEEDD
jgi:hypothetical protein